MMHIRAAAIDDADQIAAAHVDGWRVGYRHVFPSEYLDAPEFEHERFERWRAWTWQTNNDSELYVAELAGSVIGFADIGSEREQPVCDQSGGPALDSASARSKSTGEVFGFYLHSNAWGTGAATALMAESVGHLRTKGFDDAVLWVLRDNLRARAFYEKVGWTVGGRETMWDGPSTANPPPKAVAEVQYRRSLAQVLG